MTCSKVGYQNFLRDHKAFQESVPPLAGGTNLSSITPADRFGPWSDAIDAAERRARLRCLRAIVHLFLGPRGEPLTCELRRAESNDQALEYALAALNGLAALDRRRVLASYAALHRPA